MEYQIKAIQESPLVVDGFICILPGKTVSFHPRHGMWEASDRTEEIATAEEIAFAGANTKTVTLPSLNAD